MKRQRGLIFLLSGGPGSRGEAYAPLVQGVLRLPGKVKPRVAYVGAATDDNPVFAGYMKRLVARGGPCTFELAPMAGRRADRGIARAVIDDADLVLVGGGDVELGMRRLVERDLGGALRQKHADGTPFLGVSAGAILLAQHWVRWQDPDDESSAELFPCLGLAPVLCDCHGEEDGWAELHALLRLVGEGALGHGIQLDAALRVDADGGVEPVLGTVDRLVVRGGEVVSA